AFFTKLLLNRLLVPYWGIYGSSAATVLSLVLLCLLVLFTLKRKLPGLSLLAGIRWKAYLIASAVMGIYLIMLKVFGPNFSEMRMILSIYILCIILSGAFIYFVLLLRYQVFTNKQLQALPFSGVVLSLQKVVEKK